MKAKTKDILKKVGVVISIIGAVGTLVAIGNTLFGHKGSGGPGGGAIVAPDSGGSSGGGSGNVTPEPEKPKYDIDIPTTCSEIYPTFFIGGLTDTFGDYNMNEKNLFNPMAFECTNLVVALEANSNVTYEVYFFDSSDKLVSKTEDSSKSANVPVPEGAHARLELHHNAPINWQNTPTLANSVHVFTDKPTRVDLSDKSKCDYSSMLNAGEDQGNCLFFKNGDYKTASYTLNIKNGLYTLTGKAVSQTTEVLDMPFIFNKDMIGHYNFTVNPVGGVDRLGEWYIKTDQGATHATRDELWYQITPGERFKTMGHEAGNMRGEGLHFKITNKDFTKPFQFVPFLQKLSNPA